MRALNDSVYLNEVCWWSMTSHPHSIYKWRPWNLDASSVSKVQNLKCKGKITITFNLFKTDRSRLNKLTFINKKGSGMIEKQLCVPIFLQFFRSKPVPICRAAISVLSYTGNHHCLELNKKDVDLIPEAGFCCVSPLVFEDIVFASCRHY